MAITVLQQYIITEGKLFKSSHSIKASVFANLMATLRAAKMLNALDRDDLELVDKEFFGPMHFTTGMETFYSDFDYFRSNECNGLPELIVPHDGTLVPETQLLIDQKCDAVALLLLRAVKDTEHLEARKAYILDFLHQCIVEVDGGYKFKCIWVGERRYLFDSGMILNSSGYMQQLKGKGGHTEGKMNGDYWEMPRSSFRIELLSTEDIWAWLKGYDEVGTQKKVAKAWLAMPKDEKQSYINLNKFSEEEKSLFMIGQVMGDRQKLVDFLDGLNTDVAVNVVKKTLDELTREISADCTRVANGIMAGWYTHSSDDKQ